MLRDHEGAWRTCATSFQLQKQLEGGGLLRSCQFRNRDRVLAEASPYLAASSRTLLIEALNRVAENLTVEVVARHLGVHRRALEHREQRVGSMSPRRMILWPRALWAAEVLALDGLTTEQAAEACGFSSPAALRKVLWRLRIPLAMLRGAGGFDRALATFIAELAKLRGETT